MFGTKSAKFRSIQPGGSLLHSRLSGFDNAEFTKSDREKSAEILVDWRSRNGWQLRAETAASGRNAVLFWIVVHGLFIVAAVKYFRG
ncbi:MAG: hypothetical protein EOP07_15080 [Proteobacteria bacterium]|nr:MAG: hypothetical protein EOP07_15080 [Pseudomonadota bacterium]